MSRRDPEPTTALALGSRGALRGKRFRLVGRTRVRSQGGAVWNEWRCTFDDGRAGFLSEAAGALVFYFEAPLAPPYDDLRVGQAPAPFVVIERERATRIATWGAAEQRPRTYRFADLCSKAGARATIDYGEGPPRAFVGEPVTAAALGLATARGRPTFAPTQAMPRPRALSFDLAPGDRGTLQKCEVEVIGAMQRSMRIEGDPFTWEEYLLCGPSQLGAGSGLTWLVVSDGHWNRVVSVNAAAVEAGPERATLEGTSYRFSSAGTARVTYAIGELPWRVLKGDTAKVRDYVHAPHVLSCEVTATELNWSLGTYLDAAAVAKAFGKNDLRRPKGRAPNQPRKTPQPRR